MIHDYGSSKCPVNRKAACGGYAIPPRQRKTLFNTSEPP